MVGWLAGVLLAVGLVLAIARLPQHATLAEAHVLRRGNGAEAESLDPQSARSEAALTIARDLFEGLTAVDARGEPVPAAAERWSISPDGLEYVFHLRPNLRWSNGDALSAQDFVFAWQRLLDPRTAAPYAGMLADVANARAISTGLASTHRLGVWAENAATLHVRLERPVPYFLSLLTHPSTFPLHRGSLAAHAARFARPGVLISNGAFTAQRWDFGAKIVAVRNGFYWDDTHNALAGVEYFAMPASAELQAFRAGQLDFTASVAPRELPWIRAHMADRLKISPQLAVYYIGFNVRAAPFAGNVRLRQALSMAIDREQLVKSITAMGETPAYTLVAPQTQGYTPQLPEYAHWSSRVRIERARALFAQSGAQNLREIELSYNSGEPHEAIAVALASMWHEAFGLRTRLRVEEFKVLLQDVQRGEVQAFRASWVADYNDASTFLALFTRDGIDPPGYANPEYDRLLHEAGASLDPLRRRDLLERAERVLIADAPIAPLYFYVSKHLVAPRVQHWSGNPLNIIYSKSLALAAQP